MINDTFTGEIAWRPHGDGIASYVNLTQASLRAFPSITRICDDITEPVRIWLCVD
jgi:hypothetical protein